MRRRWLIVSFVLVFVGVVASASAQNQRAAHYSMTVTLAGAGSGSVYGCSVLPFLGPNPPNATNPGFTLPPCINPGIEDTCPDVATPCAWSPFNAGTTVTRETANPKTGAASLHVSATSIAQGVTDCITQGVSSGNHAASFWYRTTSASATALFSQYLFYDNLGCSGTPTTSSPLGSSSPDTSGTWSTFSNTISAPASTAAARIVLTITCNGCGLNVSANFDDVVFAPLVAGRTINCPSLCSTSGSTIQPDKDFLLIATANQGSTFTGWSGSCMFNPMFVSGCTTCSGSNTVCTLFEQEGVTDEQVVATFGTPTLVTARSIMATRRANGVLVTWKTGSDAGILGFNVYRELKNGLRGRLNRSLVTAGARPEGHAYRWLDRAAPQRAHLRYWIEERLLKGTPQWYGPIPAS